MANPKKIEIKVFIPKKAWDRVEELAQKTDLKPEEVLSKLIEEFFKEEKTPKRRRKTLGDMRDKTYG